MPVVWQWQRSRSDRRRRSDDGIAPASPSFRPRVRGRPPAHPDPEGSAPRRPGRHRTSWERTRPAAPPVSGMDEVAGAVLLAFLHINCDGCDEFWRGFRDASRAELPPGTSAAIVTKGPASVAPREISAPRPASATFRSS